LSRRIGFVVVVGVWLGAFVGVGRAVSAVRAYVGSNV